MKTTREYPIAQITPKGEKAIQGGHPWIYDAEVISLSRQVQNGELVDAVSQKGKYLGTGYISMHSKIRIRLISNNPNDKFDYAFYLRRVKYAWEYRKTVMGPDLDCCRIIFGEADQFPGLTVDKFHDVLVTQVLSYGTELHKNEIYAALKQVLQQDGINIRGIYERNDVAIRQLEGLPQYKGWYIDQGAPEDLATTTYIVENGIKYLVDFENGQKTGFFLDQKYNRLAISRLCQGKSVLDCFTHTGSFALNAVMGGAEHVTAVDISSSAIQTAKANAQLNEMDGKMDFVTTDVFDLLPQLAQQKKKPYQLIILDPPAFTKSRKTIKSAQRGYKEINYRAMKALPRGGYLATASCSHFMDDELFVKMLRSAAADAQVFLRQIEVRHQSPDHPILWNVPETAYLKFYIFQIV